MTRDEAIKKLLNCCGASVASSGDPEVHGLCEAASAIIFGTGESAERLKLICVLIDMEGSYVRERKALASKTSKAMQQALMAFAETLPK